MNKPHLPTFAFFMFASEWPARFIKSPRFFMAAALIAVLTGCAAVPPSGITCDQTGACWPTDFANTKPTIKRYYEPEQIAELYPFRAKLAKKGHVAFAFTLTDGPVCQIFLPHNPPAWLVRHEEGHCMGVTIDNHN